MNTQTITSLKDLGYKQAVTGDVFRNQAKYALENVVGFPDTVPDEAKTQLFDGYRLRFGENNETKVYAVIDGNYVIATDEMVANKKVEKIKVGVDYAYSFSQQQFGQLKNEQPQLHALIKDWRDRTGKYCSNRLADLKRQARTILNEGKQRDRAPTVSFGERVVTVLDDLKAKCKTASARGDDTANEKALREACVAFLTKWNHPTAK
jgi:hypothetical protein